MSRFHFALAIFSAMAAALLLPAASAATTDTYNYTGSVQTWVVPAGVTSATFDLYGAEGGTAFDPSFGVGGLGGRATATLTVTPGESIEIRVGGQGGSSGGFNGGGAPNDNGAGGGGGGTDIRQGGVALADRTLVAGGGGGSGACSGSGTNSPGGPGGGLLGGDAPNDGSCFVAPEAGLGGTQSSGGTGGGSAGTLGQGGAAQPGVSYWRGGGGGGYYGGGGASVYQGGGGGSGFGPSGTTFETGVRSGNGLATVTYLQPFTLTVATAGNGSGSVTSTPSGIDCHSGSSAGCTKSVIEGNEITLQASADTGSTFTGWSGAGCSGTGTCVVKLDEAASVDAAFADDPPAITSLGVTPSSFSPDPTPIKPKQLGATLEVGLSEKASVRFRVRRSPARQSGKPGSTARVFTRDLEGGDSSLPFSGTFRRTLKPGRYQVIARATDSTGQTSEKARAKFSVRG